MTSSAPPSGAARAAGIILRVILNRISYQMLSLRNRIKFYNKINKVLVYYNIQLCWNVGHPTLSNDTCTNACQFDNYNIIILIDIICYYII